MTRPILHRQSGSSGAHPSDRAATLSEPSQSSVVSGVAGIPCAFTPGPWHVEGSVVRHERGQPIPLATAWIESAWHDADATPESEANARLIAAAPDLYHALTRINDTGDDALDIDWIRRISRAALAKARGQ